LKTAGDVPPDGVSRRQCFVTALSGGAAAQLAQGTVPGSVHGEPVAGALPIKELQQLRDTGTVPPYVTGVQALRDPAVYR
jgi:hypothetical protein